MLNLFLQLLGDVQWWLVQLAGDVQWLGDHQWF